MDRKEFLAYAAGVIDSEGSIGVVKESYSTLNVGVNYFLALEVCTTSQETAEFFLATFKVGHISSGNGIHSWVCTGRTDVPSVLRQVFPYMRVKKKHCELAFEFEKIAPRGVRIDSSFIEKAQVIRDQYNLINKKGVRRVSGG